MSKLFQEIHALNERAVTLVFGDEISISTAEKISEFNRVLLARPFIGFVTSVPAYSTLTVYYDYFLVLASGLPGESGFDKVSQFLRELRVSNKVNKMATERVVIPVCYGETFGPDLEEVAQLTGLSKQDVVTLHTASLYRVH
ncbi:MAG: carboxyltransferase domain-containing protein, partial [Pedobacter sp.]